MITSYIAYLLDAPMSYTLWGSILLLHLVWEFLENTPLFINKYRSNGYVNYVGDSIINSIFDNISYMVAFNLSFGGGEFKQTLNILLVILSALYMDMYSEDNLLNVISRFPFISNLLCFELGNFQIGIRFPYVMYGNYWGISYTGGLVMKDYEIKTSIDVITKDGVDIIDEIAKLHDLIGYRLENIERKDYSQKYNLNQLLITHLCAKVFLKTHNILALFTSIIFKIGSFVKRNQPHIYNFNSQQLILLNNEIERAINKIKDYGINDKLLNVELFD